MMRRIFRVKRDGSVEVSLSIGEVEAIREVAHLVLAEVDDPGEDAVRLLPPAYADDLERQEEFERMTRDDLLARKRASAEAVVASIVSGTTKRETWSGVLDEDGVGAWLGFLNDARLLIGTKLNVTEDMDHSPLPPEDPGAAMHNMYVYLSALEGVLVEGLLDTLPAGGRS